MNSSNYKRVVCGLFLALMMLMSLCGSVLAHGTGRASKLLPLSSQLRLPRPEQHWHPLRECRW